MKVILNQNVENLGTVGEVHTVKNGFARNYLIPRGHAALATPSNIKTVEKAKAKDILKEKENRAAAEKIAQTIQALTIEFKAKVGEEGKLFGSVTNVDVQQALEAQGVTVDKKDIRMAKPIRKVGMHDIDIRVYTNLKAILKFQVEPEINAAG